MHDREFEKQVHQKMQALRFAPDAAVWDRVQAQIQKKKRRRPVVIWFLLIGLLLGGYFVFYRSGVREKNVSLLPKKQNIERTNKTQIAQTPIAVIEHKPVKNKLVIVDKTIENTPEENIQVEYTSFHNNLIPTATPPQIEKRSIATKDKEEKPTPPKKQNTSKPWQWGISAGAGISDLGMQLFKGSNVADLAFATANPPNTGSYNVPRPSAISSSAAFQIGGYVSKGITKKLGLKLGLNYEYYSNTITVGTLYNSPRAVNQGTTITMVNAYYTAGNTSNYTNKYHFISLPLSLQWKLADGKKHGLVWENGVSLSRLISATALHYDGISGTYYKDNNRFNKTQWTASSALLFTIKSKNNLQLYAGPQLQYGISNLVDGNTNNNHLRYAGLKIMAGFNKK